MDVAGMVFATTFILKAIRCCAVRAKLIAAESPNGQVSLDVQRIPAIAARTGSGLIGATMSV
jgi:hypothetical protein